MNAKQKRFVDEYLVDLNATQAAIRAGYNAKSAYSMGQRLLKHVEVATVIETERVARAERTAITQDYVLSNLREVLERCMQRAPVMVRQGREMVQLEDEEGRHVWQFDARNANGALTLLGKHLGIYIEKREITVPQGAGVLAVPVPVDAEQWAAGAAAQQAALAKRPASSTESPQ